MGFTKGNKHGKGRIKGSQNKKTVAFESLDKLKAVGIEPLTTAKEIITKLLNNNDLSIKESISLLGIMTNLFKYELITRVEEIKFDELLKENEELQTENIVLNEIIADSPKELLLKLKEK